MESRFEHDFTNVRVHSDKQSGRAADSIGAKAFTVGSDIYFGPDRYSPETTEGARLLSHELAHVAQQPGARPRHSLLGVDAPASSAERTAEEAADTVARGSKVRIAPVAGLPAVQAAFLPDAGSKGPNLSHAQTKQIWTVVSQQTVSIPPTPVGPAQGAARARRGTGVPALDDIPYLSEPRTQKSKDSTPSDLAGDKAASINTPPQQQTLPQAQSTEPVTKAPQTKPPEPVKTTPDASKKAPAAKPPEAKEKADDKGGPAVQAGRGTQVTPGAAQPVVNYVQVTVQWKDAYLVDLKNLPNWLQGMSFLGEPSLQFQYHLDNTATVDTQALVNIAQASFDVFKHKLDVSYVAGAMLNDIKTFKLRQAGQQLTPVPGGIDIEYNVARILPHLSMSIDLQSLVPLPYRPATPTKPAGRDRSKPNLVRTAAYVGALGQNEPGCV
jgi:hypothetical protein